MRGAPGLHPESHLLLPKVQCGYAVWKLDTAERCTEGSIPKHLNMDTCTIIRTLRNQYTLLTNKSTWPKPHIEPMQYCEEEDETY